MNESKLNLPALPLGRRWRISKDNYDRITVSLDEKQIITRRKMLFGPKTNVDVWICIRAQTLFDYSLASLSRKIEESALNILRSLEAAQKLDDIVESVVGLYEPKRT